MVGSTVSSTGGVFTRPYLLALNVALVEQDGRYWADASWAKDLIRHLDYLPDLTLFCPIERRDVPPGWREVPADRIKVVGYPAPETGRQFIRHLPKVGARLWRETGKADVVHSAVAGWPVPLGWITTPMARLRGKKVVLIVESAFWRALPGSKGGAMQRLKSASWEWIARACLRQADYAAYTQPDYRRTLPSPRAAGGVLIQASWINATDCLSDADARADWTVKVTAPRRFLFASRMIAPKGTAILAEAIDLLAARDADVRIDILGDGPQLGDFAKSLTSAWAKTHVRRLDPIPYDARFLTMLREYHAILVPSLSDEQPRIVYDAYSQGVPAIASDLPGLRACIEDGVTGRLVPAADAAALADALLQTAPHDLMEFGLAGLAVARSATHEKLHDDRLIALNRLFAISQ